MWVYGWPSWERVTTQPTVFLDLFLGWSAGYIVYDFIHTVRVYGEASTLILLHHLAEIIICYGVVSVHRLGSLYLMGGGLMQLSSGVLHVQRLLLMVELNLGSTVNNIIRVILVLSWAHSRVYIFPQLMYLAYLDCEMTLFHGITCLAGVILTIMNTWWLWKIIISFFRPKKHSLSF